MNSQPAMNTKTADRTGTVKKQTLSLIWKIFLPVAIGVAVVAWLFHREFDPAVLRSIHFDRRVIGCIALACLFMVGRDFGLSWRFRALTDRQLKWMQSIKTALLCEFTSCVTPSAVGGSAFGMLYLNREGIELGRATTLMMTTLFLDELFFVVSLPIIMLLVPYSSLFGFGHSTFTVGLQSVFWSVYGVTFIWTAVLFFGIFVKPHGIHRFLNWLFHFRLLKRWAAKVDTLGANIVTTGRDLRHRPLKWWIETLQRHSPFVVVALSRCQRPLSRIRSRSKPADSLRKAVYRVGVPHGKPYPRQRRHKRVALHHLLWRPYPQRRHSACHCPFLATDKLLCLPPCRSLHNARMDSQRFLKIRTQTKMTHPYISSNDPIKNDPI